MAKKIESKRKQPKSNINLKADKSKLESQEQLNEINRKREEEALQTQKDEELKILEHQVILYVLGTYYYLIIYLFYINIEIG